MGKPTMIYAMCHPITCEIRYIGKTVDMVSRKKSHYRDAKNGNQTWKSRWVRSLLAVGLHPEFLILEEIPPDKIWVEVEVFYIAYFKFLGARLCNVTAGGEGTTGRVVSEELRIKSSERNKGKIMSEESRAKMSLAKTGVRWTKEAVEKRSNTVRGTPRTLEVRARLSAAMRGVKKSTTINMSGELSPHAILTEEQVKDILLCYYSTTLKLSEFKDFGVTSKYLSDITRGVSWKHLNWYREELRQKYGDRKPRTRSKNSIDGD